MWLCSCSLDTHMNIHFDQVCCSHISIAYKRRVPHTHTRTHTIQWLKIPPVCFQSKLTWLDRISVCVYVNRLSSLFLILSVIRYDCDCDCDYDSIVYVLLICVSSFDCMRKLGFFPTFSIWIWTEKKKQIVRCVSSVAFFHLSYSFISCNTYQWVFCFNIPATIIYWESFVSRLNAIILVHELVRLALALIVCYGPLDSITIHFSYCIGIWDYFVGWRTERARALRKSSSLY